MDKTPSDLDRVERMQNPWFLPGAILAAGLVLALAVYAERTHHILARPAGSPEKVRPVTPADHIIGNPSAPVKLIEYDDIDSSYGKQFQATLEQLMTEYAKGNNVAWVYRHFPLIDQHVNAEMHAEAAECAASLGGPSTFWNFIDALSARAPGTSQFDPRDYPSVISTLGINTDAFNRCLSTHAFQQKVGSDFDNAIAIGADATPFTVLLVKGQPPVTISGAVSYDTLKKVVDQAVAKAAATK